MQITGSHNPPDENGFKMMRGKASLFGDDVRKLREMILARDFELPGGGTSEEVDVMPAYAGFMKGNIRLARRDLRFAIDAGNGAGGPAALAACNAVGLDPIPLLCEMDGRFPVHHPDPTEVHNVELLRRTVLERGLEFGVAFDGDADRIGVIDEKGEILWGDRLMILLSRALLEERPGAAVLGEVKCSQTLYDDIEEHGGRPILWKTGHSLIKTKMKEEGALLAGEMSGHIFFADRFFGFDDAVYAMLRLAEIVAAPSPTAAREEAVAVAVRLADENAAAGEAIGRLGAELLADGARVLTHCNAGWLAFVDWGSALAPVYMAARQGKRLFVYADETRPRCQGARLTAWELCGEGIPHAIIADNAAGHLMRRGVVDAVIVGADRIAANGDFANKIGTFEKAVLAKELGVPFYTAAPLSTFDLGIKRGEDIPIEYRGEEEVTVVDGVRIAPQGCKALNPGFDVTPAKYLSGIITEEGMIRPEQVLKRLKGARL